MSSRVHDILRGFDLASTLIPPGLITLTFLEGVELTFKLVALVVAIWWPIQQYLWKKQDRRRSR